MCIRDRLKASLYDQLPENIGVVGKGKYVDKELRQLHITITMDAKTYVDVSYTHLDVYKRQVDKISAIVESSQITVTLRA